MNGNSFGDGASRGRRSSETWVGVTLGPLTCGFAAVLAAILFMGARLPSKVIPGRSSPDPSEAFLSRLDHALRTRGYPSDYAETDVWRCYLECRKRREELRPGILAALRCPRSRFRMAAAFSVRFLASEELWEHLSCAYPGSLPCRKFANLGLDELFRALRLVVETGTSEEQLVALCSMGWVGCESTIDFLINRLSGDGSPDDVNAVLWHLVDIDRNFGGRCGYDDPFGGIEFVSHNLDSTHDRSWRDWRAAHPVWFGR